MNEHRDFRVTAPLAGVRLRMIQKVCTDILPLMLVIFHFWRNQSSLFSCDPLHFLMTSTAHNPHHILYRLPLLLLFIIFLFHMILMKLLCDQTVVVLLCSISAIRLLYCFITSSIFRLFFFLSVRQHIHTSTTSSRFLILFNNVRLSIHIVSYSNERFKVWFLVFRSTDLFSSNCLFRMKTRLVIGKRVMLETSKWWKICSLSVWNILYASPNLSVSVVWLLFRRVTSNLHRMK